MSHSPYQGRLVRLAAIDPDKDAAAFARWTHNSEYDRMLDSDPARPLGPQAFKTMLGQEADAAGSALFAIRTLEGDRLIGFVALDAIQWVNSDAWVAIGLGEPGDWGRGYGTEAMRLMLGHAFNQLGLRRVTLAVFDYNERARRSYEKAGFTLEGRQRGRLLRDGRRHDMLLMGLLREEWERQNPNSQNEIHANSLAR